MHFWRTKIPIEKHYDSGNFNVQKEKTSVLGMIQLRLSNTAELPLSSVVCLVYNFISPSNMTRMNRESFRIPLSIPHFLPSPHQLRGTHVQIDSIPRSPMATDFQYGSNHDTGRKLKAVCDYYMMKLHSCKLRLLQKFVCLFPA